MLTERGILNIVIDRAKEIGPDAVKFFEQPNDNVLVASVRKRFAENLFASLYTTNPETHFRFNSVKIGNQVEEKNHEQEFFEKLMGSTVFDQVRESTTRNLILSTSTAMEMFDEAYSAFNNYRRANETDYMREDGEPDSGDALAGKIRTMCDATQEKVEDLKDAMMLLGGKGYGTFPSSMEMTLPDEETKKALAAIRRMPNLASLIKMLGRVHRIKQLSKTDEVRRGSVIPHKIELGNDIPQILPAELAMGRRLRLMFLASLAEGGLLMDGLGEPDTKESGGVYVICDESGSMDLENRILWAKSIAAAMYIATKEEGRTFKYFSFGGRLDGERTTLDGILRANFDHGSTDIPRSLSDFAAKVDGGDSEDLDTTRQSDILFITDGDSPRKGKEAEQKFREFLKKYNVRMLAIQICDGKRSETTTMLEAYSDKVIVTGSDPSSDPAFTKEVFDWSEGVRS